jgi:hypothetical protein
MGLKEFPGGKNAQFNHNLESSCGDRREEAVERYMG